jgi:hypothetical protein
MIKSKPLDIIANIISVLLHPLLVTSFACYLVFSSGHYITVFDTGLRNSILLIFFIMTFAIPALTIPIMKYFRFIRNIETDEKNDRITALGVVCVIYLISFYFMNKVAFPEILMKIIITAIISVAACLVITLFWRISLHACGFGALAGFLVFLFWKFGLDVRMYFFFVVIASGLVATARLYLGKHRPPQIYGGWFAGFVFVILSLTLF